MCEESNEFQTGNKFDLLAVYKSILNYCIILHNKYAEQHDVVTLN